jgi:hypothetical protein
VWWEHLSGNADPRGMIHLEDARKLSDSAATGCPLCGLIVNAVLQMFSQPRPTTSTVTSAGSKQSRNQQCDPLLRGELIDHPIYLRPNYDTRKPSFPEVGAADPWHVRGLKAFVPTCRGVQVGLIRLFATQGKGRHCFFFVDS